MSLQFMDGFILLGVAVDLFVFLAAVVVVVGLGCTDVLFVVASCASIRVSFFIFSLFFVCLEVSLRVLVGLVCLVVMSILFL